MIDDEPGSIYRFHECRKDFYGFDITNSRDPSSRRWLTALGLQPQLGLRPERRLGIDITYRGYSDAHGAAVGQGLGISDPLPRMFFPFWSE